MQQPPDSPDNAKRVYRSRRRAEEAEEQQARADTEAEIQPQEPAEAPGRIYAPTQTEPAWSTTDAAGATHDARAEDLAGATVDVGNTGYAQPADDDRPPAPRRSAVSPPRIIRPIAPRRSAMAAGNRRWAELPARLRRQISLALGVLIAMGVIALGWAGVSFIVAQEAERKAAEAERLRIEAEQLERANHPLRYRELIERYAHANVLDPALVAAVILCESSFDPEAVSRQIGRAHV